MQPITSSPRPVRVKCFLPAWCLLGSVILCGAATALAAEPSQPNIVVIVGDDMGYADVGTQGCRDIPTPHLDALANGGVRCTNGYVSGPYCSPTRAGLMTGRYQTRFGHEFNPAAVNGNELGLPLSEITLANRLKDAGYATGLVGKWHLGELPRFHPLQRGFDEFFGFLGGAHSYFPGQGASILRGKQRVEENEYLTDAFGREAVAFIDQHRDQPFFLYLAFNAVHMPLQAPEDRLKQFAAIADPQRQAYAAMMSAMDDAVGAVLAKLQATELENNTLVFFISDNGGPAVNGSKNAPLHGFKRTTFEGGIRVPFFVKWPARLPAGKVYDQPVIQLDILPTALASAGVQIDPAWKLDGVDLLTYLSGDAPEQPHEALCWRLGQQMAIRQGDWKLLRSVSQANGAANKATRAQLYNLADDIGEQHDLSQQQPEQAAALQAAWDDWNAANVAPSWHDGLRANRQKPAAR
ncbi:MAG: sulfatase [Planctomycetes bacterium]|nr:sulfatase [Planctomycetota bacterium]